MRQARMRSSATSALTLVVVYGLVMAMTVATMTVATQVWAFDCNLNGIDVVEDLSAGSSKDCDGEFEL